MELETHVPKLRCEVLLAAKLYLRHRSLDSGVLSVGAFGNVVNLTVAS